MAVYPSPSEMQEVTLLDIVDTALDKGVMLQGSAIISVADVDLVFLGLNLVLASIDTVRPGGRSGVANHTPQEGGSDQVPGIGDAAAQAEGNAGGWVSNRHGGRQSRPSHFGLPALDHSSGRGVEATSPDEAGLRSPRRRESRSRAAGDRPAESQKPWADPDKVEQGLAKLVLTVVELLRQLLERQALRRMERGSLTDEEVERMGLTFQRLEEKMDELKAVFGLAGEDLDLDLGPLGNLM